MDGFNRDRVSARIGSAGVTADQRRARDSLFLMAQVRVSAERPWADVRVRNLSAGGLMAEIDEPLAIGTPIELDLRGVGQITGRIAWQAEGRTGVAFDVEIDPKKARKPLGQGKPVPYAEVIPRKPLGRS